MPEFAGYFKQNKNVDSLKKTLNFFSKQCFFAENTVKNKKGAVNSTLLIFTALRLLTFARASVGKALRILPCLSPLALHNMTFLFYGFRYLRLTEPAVVFMVIYE